MKFTRTSPITGKELTLDLDVTPEEISAWEDGELIQLALPRLNEDEREFLLTGMHPGEWEALFGDTEED